MVCTQPWQSDAPTLNKEPKDNLCESTRRLILHHEQLYVNRKWRSVPHRAVAEANIQLGIVTGVLGRIWIDVLDSYEGNIRV